MRKLNLSRKTNSIIFGFYKVILAASVFFTIIGIAVISRLDIKTDIFDALPSKNPAIDDFVDFLNDFGGIDNLVIALKSKDKKIDDYLEVAESVGKKLKESHLIEYADYNIIQTTNKELIFKNFPLFLDAEGIDALKKKLSRQSIEKQIIENKRRILSPVSSPIDSELMKNDPLNLRSIVFQSIAKRNLKGINTRHGYYISADNSILLIFAKPIGSSRDMKFVRRLEKEIYAVFGGITKEYGQNHDLQYGLAGAYAFAIESQASLKRDVLINAASSALLVLLLFQFVYKKRFLVLLITAATLLTALSWTLGLAYLIFGSLNMASSVITAMLMGLGIDYIVHIFNRWEDEFTRTRDLRYSLETTFTKTASGVIAGAATTSIAFFSILSTNFKGLYQLGTVAGIGVLACLVSTLFVMTSLVLFIEVRKKGLLFSKEAHGFGVEKADRIIRHYPAKIIFAGIIILSISFAGLFFLRFDSSPEAIGPKTSKVMLLEKEISEHFGRERNPIMIAASAENKEKLMKRNDELITTANRFLDKGIAETYTGLDLFLPLLSKQEDAISALKEIRKSMNPDDMEKAFKDAMEENGFIVNGQYTAYINNIKNILVIEKPIRLDALEGSNDKKTRHFYNSEKMKTAAYLFPKGRDWDSESVSLIQKEMEKLGSGFSVTGYPIVFSNLKTSIVRESIKASIIAFILIFFIIYLKFGTIKRVFLALTPLSAGFIITLGIMGIMDIKFNYISIGAVTLLFGIGIDYGVYIMQDYLEKRQDGPEHTLKHIGRTIIMCAVTTIAGFGSLMTMQFKGIASIGMVIAIGVSACLLCALFFLPVLIYYIEDKQ